ncbi:hypothetical protein DSO57_1031275 [Entomophthora muscae]|nr:hypothetical protein DSO57_1031275 [Entomophthora muscae]
MRSVSLKKFINWIDLDRPDLSEFESKIFCCIRKCCCDTSRELRALAMRAFRHLMCLTRNPKPILSMHFEFFIIRFLTVETKWEAEKEQAILTIRSILTMPAADKYITDGIIRAVCSIAEQSGDKHRTICIELLCELLVFKTEAVSRSGGVRTIIHSLFELPYDMAKSIIQLLLALLDKPETRCYIRPGVDFEFIFSVFGDSCERTGAQREKLKTCSKLVLEFLRNWNGVMYLCIDNKRAARSIVSALAANGEDTRKIILEMFYLLFNLNLPNWNADLSTLDPEDFHNRLPSHLHDRNLSLVDQHYAIVLHLLYEAGIIEKLTQLIKEPNRYIVFYSTILISEILKLSNNLTSKSKRSAQSLPGLFHLATLFKDEELRHIAQASIARIDNSNLLFLRYLNGTQASDGFNAQEHKQMEKIKQRICWQVDDNHFKNMLNDSQVLVDKNFKKWNWETIMELLQGPLLNVKRLEETIKSTKFIKRLLNFYTPGNHQFAEIRYSKLNHLFVQVGCELMNTLLANAEGVKYLAECDLLPQLEAALAELDPINGSLQNDHIFSKDRMQGTLTPYYFTLLGSLSKLKTGIRLLEKFHIFDLYYHVSELRSRDDLVRAIINSLDYRREGHARVILSKVLTSAYKHIRLFATNFLRVLLRKDIPGFSDWGIYLLITQLYDPALEVSEMAVSVLDEACMKQENLNTLIKLKPSMSHLEFAGDSLLLRYLSSTEGLEYLLDRDYVETQMDTWFNSRNLHYVTRVELSLLRALESAESPEVGNRGSYWFDEKHESIIEDPEKLKKLDGFIFPHFYGELTKTCKGCEILQEKGHLTEFSSYLRVYREESSDDSIIFRLKANLWALGHIGASEIGITLLAKADIIEDIKWIAENSQVFSLKGSAVYVLGLIGRTELGDEVLHEAMWGSVFGGFDHLGTSTPKCWTTVSEWQYKGSLYSPASNLLEHNQLEREILTSIGNLSNHILANTGSRVLVRIKGLHPEQFQRADLFYEALHIVNHYHFRLAARQFVFELFEIALCSETFDTWSLVRKRLEIPSLGDAADPISGDGSHALAPAETFMDSFIDGNYSPVHEETKRLSRHTDCIDKIALEPIRLVRGFCID